MSSMLFAAIVTMIIIIMSIIMINITINDKICSIRGGCPEPHLRYDVVPCLTAPHEVQRDLAATAEVRQRRLQELLAKRRASG